MSLQGKVAIITGAARGIAARIVRALSNEGAKVAFNYVSTSSRSAAESMVESLRNEGREAFCIQADLATEEAPEIIITAVLSAFQTTQIDILVNNAGMGDNKPLEEVTLESYNKLMDINVRAVLFMTQAVLPYIPRGGRPINLSSISARGGYSTQSVYAATKAAVEGLTRVWATELGHKYGVTVNAMNPGPVDTDMYQAAGPVHLARMEEQNKKVPAGQRCGSSQDIADIVTFLAQERSRWVTGDVMCANGGMIFI
ncbi:short chain oxidoreductase/dehydrogenase [Penicillium sp. IBT 16267x]|nr:short chain oxidoreductase/dehydrogenase [Penicillium sp. IBT 16267x]